jgi:ubiquinol-cytochrome c reductase core subunit 2
VKEAGKVAVKALKAGSTLKAEDLKKAIAKAKFATASGIDGRDGLVSVLGSKASPFFF